MKLIIRYRLRTAFKAGSCKPGLRALLGNIMDSSVSEALLVLQRWKASFTDVSVAFVSSGADVSVRSRMIFSRLTGKVVLVTHESLNFIVQAASGAVFTAGLENSEIEFGTSLDVVGPSVLTMVESHSEIDEMLVINHASQSLILLFTQVSRSV